MRNFKIQDLFMSKKQGRNLFRIMKLTCFMLLLLMVTLQISATTYSQSTKNQSERETGQTITVTGTVSDASGPLPGVSVRVKGTTSGTATDINGRYTINVPDGDAVLQFSFVGYLSP